MGKLDTELRKKYLIYKFIIIILLFFYFYSIKHQNLDSTITVLCFSSIYSLIFYIFIQKFSKSIFYDFLEATLDMISLIFLLNFSGGLNNILILIYPLLIFRYYGIKKLLFFNLFLTIISILFLSVLQKNNTIQVSLTVVLLILIYFYFLSKREKIETKSENYNSIKNSIYQIYNLSEILIKSNDLDKMLNDISNFLYNYLNFKNVFFYFIDETRENLILKGTFNKRKEEIGLKKIKLGDGLLSYPFKTKNWVYIDDVNKDSRYIKIVNNIKSEFIHPIKIRDGIIGVMGFENEKSLNNNELKNLITISNMINLSIEKLFSLSETKKKIDSITLINHVTTYLVSSLDLNEVTKKIVEILTEYFNYEYIGILLRYEDKLKVVYSVGFKTKDFEIGIDSEKGIVAHTFRNKKTIILNDVSKDPRFIKDSDSKSEMAVPIIFENEVIGIINIESPLLNRFTEDDKILIETLSNTIGIAIMNAKLFEETKKLSIIDSLTGLGNYRYLVDSLNKEIEKAKRYELPISLIFLDLDNFKRINDTKGHEVGNIILIKVSQIIKENIRTSDSAFRYGGDEFVILLPFTDKLTSREVAERIRLEVENTEVSDIKLSASFGVASYPEDGLSSFDLIGKSDKFAYISKSYGGNRIHF